MRRTVQLLLLAIFVYLISLTKWPPSNTVLVDLFLALDPLLTLQAVLASRAWIDTAVYGIVLLGLAVLLGRFFCGWMCPFGTCLELGDELLYRKKKNRLWKNRDRKFRGVKYGILLAIVVGAVFGQGFAYLFDPICWATRIMTYAIWPIGSSLVSGFLFAGRPVFEEMGWFYLARAHIDTPVFGVFGIASLGFFAFLLWLGRFQRRFWCRCLCPLGALLAIPSRISLFHRQVGTDCDEDGKCGRVCETGAIPKTHRDYDPSECIQCGRCVSQCHLEITKFVPTLNPEGKTPSFDLSRRKAVEWLGLGALVSTWTAFSPKRSLLGDEGLRPPGAVPEDSFLATCVRCGQCIKACPTKCLQPAAGQTGPAGFMSPIAMMRLGPCDQNCSACGHVCPTDAIQDLNLDEKVYAKIGNAVIEPGRCIVWEQDRHCLVCDENCPYGAIYWKEVELGGQGGRRPFVNENRCNGCGQCETACPIEGKAAIRIFPAGQIRLDDGCYYVEARKRGIDLTRIDSMD
jgi:ferredoxin-type protein NapF